MLLTVETGHMYLKQQIEKRSNELPKHIYQTKCVICYEYAHYFC